MVLHASMKTVTNSADFTGSLIGILPPPQNPLIRGNRKGRGGWRH